MSISIGIYRAGGSLLGSRPKGSFGDGLDLSIFSLALSGAGRIGFYQDYSELSSVGSHTFYVQRTHGSSGAVSVTYTSSGDSHSIVTGLLSWADGEIGVKSITVPVANKSNGEHRIALTLSSPTNGAALHNGTHTVAYGVIDDGTIAADSDAVFYDSAAVTNGTGTQASPYNSIYDAISNVGSKRYLYGKGITIPDGTNTANPNGGGGIVNCINFPATRTGEADRLIIRNWPSNTWTVSGGGGNEEIGFYSDGGKNYITFKGIDFSALSAWSGVGSKFAEGGGISCLKAVSEGINVESCTFDDIDGSTNTAGFNPYLVTGAKVWRSTFNNIKVNGDNTSANSAGVLTYSGKDISVQRCEFTNCHSGVYQKRVDLIGDASIKAQFNKFESEAGVLLGTAGGGNSHSYSLIQSNLFKGCTKSGIDHNNIFQTSTLGEKHHWSNNVFDGCGSGELAAISFQYAFSAIIFNNIMLDCRKVWADIQDRSSLKTPDVEYADYNNETGTTLPSQRYEYRATNYSTAAALSGFGFAQNDTQADPAFDASYNTSLTGLGSVPQGVYLTGNEQIGVGLGVVDSFLVSQNTAANSGSAIWASSQVADGNGAGTFADPYSLRGAVYNATLGSEVVLKDDGVYQLTNPLDIKSDASDSTPEDFAGGPTGGTVWGGANPKVVSMNVQKPSQESERILIRGEQGKLPVIDCQEMHFMHIENAGYFSFKFMKFINTQTVFFINPASPYLRFEYLSFDMTLDGDNKSPLKVSGGITSDYGVVNRCYMKGPGQAVDGMHTNTCGIYVRLLNHWTFENITIHNFPLGIYFKHPNDPYTDVAGGVANVTGIFRNIHTYDTDRDYGNQCSGNGWTFENCLTDGFGLGGGGGGGANGVMTGGADLRFINCTFRNRLSFVGDSASEAAGGSNTPYFRDCVIGERVYGLPWDASPIFTADSDYNLFAENFFQVNGNGITYNDWKTLQGGDANSIQAAPSFVGSDKSIPSDWALVASSSGTSADTQGNDMGCDVSKVGLFGAAE